MKCMVETPIQPSERNGIFELLTTLSHLEIGECLLPLFPVVTYCIAKTELSLSYTDEGRLGYFWNHGGNPVPIGTVLPFSPVDSDGGIIWDRWVSIYTEATLFDYATAGAVCSNNIVKKYVPGIAAPIPDVLGSEIPSFIGDTKYINASTGTNTVYGTNRRADNSVYALWIGTSCDPSVHVFCAKGAVRYQ